MAKSVHVEELYDWVNAIRQQFGTVVLGESMATFADRGDVRNEAKNLEKPVAIILNTTIHSHVMAAVGALARLHDNDDERRNNRICIPRLFRVLDDEYLLHEFCQGKYGLGDFEAAKNIWNEATSLISEHGAELGQTNQGSEDSNDLSINTGLRKFRNSRFAHFLDLEPDPLYGADIWKLATNTGSVIDYLGKASGRFTVSVRHDRQVWDDRVRAYFSKLLDREFQR